MDTAIREADSPARPAVVARRTGDRWGLAVFSMALVALLAASLVLMAQIGMTGDEPWYVLQGYSLVHDHTVDMTAVVHNQPVYSRLLANLPPDHVDDYRGNGVLVVPYLPGYAAIVGPLYLLGGRFLIIMAQVLLAAGMAALLLREARLLWRSRAVALFALLAFLTSLPALLYVGQVFPSILAEAVAFGSFVLVVRVLPRASGRRLVLTAAAVGALAMVVPWLHVKYAPLMACIAAGALLQLWSAARTRPAGDGRRAARAATALLCGLPLVSLALIALYSRHYFGTWYPQYHSLGDAAYSGFDLSRIASLFGEILFDGTSGLIPWAPLLLLAPAGWVILARRQRRYAGLLLLWVFGVQCTFFSAAFAPLVGQAYALPARFSVECQPFYALCVAALFAAVWSRLRRGVAAARGGAWRAAVNWRSALALACVALLLVDAWFTLVALHDPLLLYPNAAGNRIVAAYPQLLPGWWFHLFMSRPS